MKKEYDFSKAVRGQFYRQNAKLDLPAYLNADNKRFVEEIAKKKHTDLSSSRCIRGTVRSISRHMH